MKKFAKIIASGSYLPEKVLTNYDLEKILDTTHEWIYSRSGISERRIAEKESTCDLAFEASKKALSMAGIDSKELDLIILATTTPDKIFPATATVLQNRIGAYCPAFDLQAVCAGFIFAMTTAKQYIENGSAKKILIVCSETISRIVNWQDRGSAILFGDGAGAVILSAEDSPGLIHSKIFSDGQYLEMLKTSDNYIDELGKIEMSGNEVFKIAVKKLSNLAEQSLLEANLSSEDIDWLVPHQANIRIIQAIAKKINMPMEKVILTINKHGNTSAASIPLALDIAIRDGRIKPGDNIMFEGVGAGFSWGSIIAKL